MFLNRLIDIIGKTVILELPVFTGSKQEHIIIDIDTGIINLVQLKNGLLIMYLFCLAIRFSWCVPPTFVP